MKRKKYIKTTKLSNIGNVDLESFEIALKNYNLYIEKNTAMGQLYSSEDKTFVIGEDRLHIKSVEHLGLDIALVEVSHRITKVTFEDDKDTITVNLELLMSPYGHILKLFSPDNLPINMRCIGKISKDEDKIVILDKIVAFDFFVNKELL